MPRKSTIERFFRERSKRGNEEKDKKKKSKEQKAEKARGGKNKTEAVEVHCPPQMPRHDNESRADVTVQCKDETRDVAIQTEEMELSDSSTQTYESPSNIKANFILIQNQMKDLKLTNERLKNINNELLTKIRKMDASLPRKAFTELGKRQIRRRSLETERFVNIRSPSLLRENECPNRLSPLEDIAMVLDIGLTGKQRENLKKELRKNLHDPFAPTNLVKSIKKDEGKFSKFNIKNNGIFCMNVLEVLSRRIQRLYDNGMLQQKNNILNVVLAGDKGGDKLANTSKFGFFISTNAMPNSYRNFSFLACWHGDDGRKQQEKWLHEVLKQIDQIYDVQLKNRNLLKIQWMMCVDLKFLKDFIGHKGAASLHPCSLCRAPKNEIRNLGVTRTFEGTSEDKFSCNYQPLLMANRFAIICPSMHVLHGILNKSMKILWDNSGENCLEMSYGIIGARPDSHTHQFCGNSVRKVIAKRHDLALLIADTLKRKKWEDLMFAIALAFRLSRSLELNDKGLKKFEEVSKTIITLFYELMGKIIPKMHYLLHMVEFAKEHRWVGLLSDQCLESVHSKFNSLVSRYHNTGDRSLALERMVRHQALWNLIYDTKKCEKMGDTDDDKDDQEVNDFEVNNENVPPFL